MTDRCRLDFPKWVPEAAKRELQQLANDSEADHRLLKRLASYDVMRSDVWQKLPAVARSAEHLIIRRTYAVARLVQIWLQLEDIRKNSWLPEAGKVASLAAKLLAAMKKASPGSDWHVLWQRVWPGDRMTFEDALLFIERLEAFYRDADELYEVIVEGSTNISQLRKKNARNASEIVFTRGLTSLFQHDFGRPLYTIVEGLASVVFEKKGEGAMAATIRGRRRSAPRR
jgi:hypothetical protein